jgi:Zinc-ribbon containing domain
VTASTPAVTFPTSAPVAITRHREGFYAASSGKSTLVNGSRASRPSSGLAGGGPPLRQRGEARLPKKIDRLALRAKRRIRWPNRSLLEATFPQGTYRCTNCGNTITMGSQSSIPPCPSCNHGEWETVGGGDSAADPYPGRS